MRESSTARWCTGTRRTPEWRTRLTLGIDKFKKLQVLLRKHVVDARRALRASHLSKGYSHLRSMVPGSRDNLTGLFDTAVHCVLLRSTLLSTSWFGVRPTPSGLFPHGSIVRQPSFCSASYQTQRFLRPIPQLPPPFTHTKSRNPVHKSF
jgi:hypothetical protein